MGIKLEITEKAMDFITDKGYDDNYGARPLKRVIQKNIEDKLSEELLRGNISENSVVRVDCIDNELVFEKF